MSEKKTSRRPSISESGSAGATALASRPTNGSARPSAAVEPKTSEQKSPEKPTPAPRLRVVTFVTIDFEGAAGDWTRSDMADGGGYFYEHRGDGASPKIELGLADGRKIENRSGRILIQGASAHFWEQP